MKTDRCQVSHVGYAVSGKITVRMKDGGHDAWVEGDQPFVGIEAMSADVYAKS